MGEQTIGNEPTALGRRTALALIGAGTAASLPGSALAKSVRSRPLPWMASPEQIWAERIVLRLSADPAIRRIQAIPPGLTGDGLIRELRVAARAAGYNSRAL